MGVISTSQIYGLTIRESANDGSDFTNPAADYRRLFLGEDGLLHLRDSAGTVTDIGAAGSVATDAIWDAAGDLAVGSGANTAARLAIGAAGGALSRVNGAVAWNSGTSFPTAATGDRYWRTDLGMEAYYDGTRWLTTQIFHCTLAYASTLTPATAGGAAYRGVLYGSTYDQWLIEMRTAVHVATTNNGSNYWVATLADQAGGAIGGGVSFNTSADAVNTWVYKTTAIGAVLSGKIEIQATLTSGAGSPGPIYFVPIVAYRLILT